MGFKQIVLEFLDRIGRLQCLKIKTLIILTGVAVGGSFVTGLPKFGAVVLRLLLMAALVVISTDKRG